jgi:hypothetical protein
MELGWINNNGEVVMGLFEQFIEDVRKHARHKMECKIRRNEDQAALGGFSLHAKPKFTEDDKEALRLNAESEAVDRVLAMLRKAAFPDE